MGMFAHWSPDFSNYRSISKEADAKTSILIGKVHVTMVHDMKY